MRRFLAFSALGLLLLAGCRPAETSITVTGYVYDALGTPLAGVRVQVAGRPLATTDADGSFSVTGVETPYRAIVELAPDRFLVLDGLTVAQPRIYDFGIFGGSGPEATIAGDVTDTAAGHKLAVAFVGPGGFGIDLNDSAAGSTPYSLDASLFEGSATGRLYALEWSLDPAGNAQNFTGFKTSSELTVADGGVFGGQDLTLDPAPSTHDLVVSFAYPTADYDLRALTAGLRPWNAEHYGVPLLHTAVQPVPDPATVRSPKLPTARTALTLIAEVPGGGSPIGAAWTGVPASETAATLSLPARTALLAPADGAAGVDAGTAFSWNGPGGLYLFALSTGPTRLTGLTAATGFELPDLSAFGASYGAAEAYTWGVLNFKLDGLAESATDELVQGAAGRLLATRVFFPLLGGFTVDDGSGYAVLSPERGFTTP